MASASSSMVPAARSSTDRSPRSGSSSPASRSGRSRTWTKPWPGRAAVPIRCRAEARSRSGRSSRPRLWPRLWTSRPRNLGAASAGSWASPERVGMAPACLSCGPGRQGGVTAGETHQAIEATFRIERARLVAGLARVVRNFDVAEELAQDALVVALSEWPKTGVPANPGAWLMAAAKRRAIDALRRDKMRERKHEEIARTLDETVDGRAEAIEAAMDDDLGDELLGLIFTACHPMLSPDARAALSLKVVGGLTTDEIARAFLSSEDAIAQRIVRAKKAIAKAGLTFEVPRGVERAARLSSVLEVIYLIFNEGYAATAGDDLVRPGLCLEAQRLGRVLAGLMPEDAEVLGLLALMEIQASRLGTRTGPDGAFIPLTKQDRARWDQLLIGRGLDALARAEALGGDGPYALQAALAACHARARS